MRTACLLCLCLLSTLGCDGVAARQGRDDVDGRAPDVERSLVAMGVARLTTRHAAALLAAIDLDQRCGFASQAAKASLQLSGHAGSDGTATWTVQDCTLRFAPEQKLNTDCGGVELWVGGAATVSATRTVRGVITNDPLQPLAPDDAQAATVELHVSFDGLSVRDTAGGHSMRVDTGTLSVTAQPTLAPSRSAGVCSVATPRLTLRDLRLTDAQLEVAADGRTLRPSVPTSRFDAQVGQGPEHENWLQGEVTVWETAVAVPTPDDQGGLDPSYDREAFVRSFSCNAELRAPLGTSCPPPRERPAQGAAALSVKLFGVVARALEHDERCGFANPAVKSAPAPSGVVGQQGAATWTLPSPCRLTFPAGTVVETDCVGTQTVLSGSVTVTGSKTVSGYLTGDPAEPVVPASSSPASLSLVLQPESLLLTEVGGTNGLLVKRGTLSGTLQPKTGLDRRSRACSIATPVAHVTLSHQNTEVELLSGTLTLPLTLDSSLLEAQSGTAGGKTNFLEGVVTSGGQRLHVPSLGEAPELDPGYEPAKFADAYRCDPNLEVPADEEACSFAVPLAEGAARLLVQNAAAVVKLINGNGKCGFDDENVLKDPYLVKGSVGHLGQMGWRAKCGVGPAARQTLSTDCNQVVTTVEGTAWVSATRVVDGMRKEECGGPFNLICEDSIVPIKPDAVVFTIDSAKLSSFAAGNDEGRLTVHTGTLATTARTIQGCRSNGHCDLATPIAGFSDLTLTGATVTLQTGKKKFSFAIPAATVTAFNGSFGGKRNSLSGTLTVGTQVVALGALPLQPGYSQAAFDQSYACTPNLVATLPP